VSESRLTPPDSPSDAAPRGEDEDETEMSASEWENLPEDLLDDAHGNHRRHVQQSPPVQQDASHKQVQEPNRPETIPESPQEDENREKHNSNSSSSNKQGIQTKSGRFLVSNLERKKEPKEQKEPTEPPMKSEKIVEEKQETPSDKLDDSSKHRNSLKKDCENPQQQQPQEKAKKRRRSAKVRHKSSKQKKKKKHHKSKSVRTSPTQKSDPTDVNHLLQPCVSRKGSQSSASSRNSSDSHSRKKSGLHRRKKGKKRKEGVQDKGAEEVAQGQASRASLKRVKVGRSLSSPLEQAEWQKQRVAKAASKEKDMKEKGKKKKKTKQTQSERNSTTTSNNAKKIDRPEFKRGTEFKC